MTVDITVELQSADDVLPAVDDELAMHTLQSVDAVVFWYLPASQSTQALASDASANVPAAHGAHAVIPV